MPARVTFEPHLPAAGAGVCVVVVDSGIAHGHPHVGDVRAGRAFVGDDPGDTADRLGHGTAVAAAIREKAPAATLMPARVLERSLATSARMLGDAITWAAGEGARLVNLSLGTTNTAHVPLFEAAIAAAVARGMIVVSARGEAGARWFPGSLAGVVGVAADPASPRFALAVEQGPLGPALLASPFPRPIPGVVMERNLSGVSFAVANATGLLARVLELEPGLRTAADVLGWIAARAVPGTDDPLILRGAGERPAG